MPTHSLHLLLASTLLLVLNTTACSDAPQSVEESRQSDETADELIANRQGINERLPENVKFGSKPLQVIPGGIQIVNPQGNKVTEYTFGADSKVVLNAVATALGKPWNISNENENCGNTVVTFPLNFSVSVAQNKFVGWDLSGFGGDPYEVRRTQIRTADGIGINSLLAEFEAISDVKIVHYPEYSVFEVNEKGMSGFEAIGRPDEKDDISIYGSLDRELGEVYIPSQVEGVDVDSSFETIASLSSGITCNLY